MCSYLFKVAFICLFNRVAFVHCDAGITGLEIADILIVRIINNNNCNHVSVLLKSMFYDGVFVLCLCR